MITEDYVSFEIAKLLKKKDLMKNYNIIMILMEYLFGTISNIPYGSCKHNPKYGGDDADSGQWTTYEGACEAAIKYCLENLI